MLELSATSLTATDGLALILLQRASSMVACGWDSIVQVPSVRWDIHTQPALPEPTANPNYPLPTHPLLCSRCFFFFILIAAPEGRGRFCCCGGGSGGGGMCCCCCCCCSLCCSLCWLGEPGTHCLTSRTRSKRQTRNFFKIAARRPRRRSSRSTAKVPAIHSLQLSPAPRKKRLRHESAMP